MKLTEAMELYSRLSAAEEVHYQGQSMRTGMRGLGGSNQSEFGIEGEIHAGTIKPVADMSAEDWILVNRGFQTIRIHFWVTWGGFFHDGSPRGNSVQTSVMIADSRTACLGTIDSNRHWSCGGFSKAELKAGIDAHRKTLDLTGFDQVMEHVRRLLL
jgi:hypothetical protein